MSTSKNVEAVNVHATKKTSAGIEPWDTEWAAEQAAAALRYLARNAPEVLEDTSVLEPHEEARPRGRHAR